MGESWKDVASKILYLNRHTHTHTHSLTHTHTHTLHVTPQCCHIVPGYREQGCVVQGQQESQFNVARATPLISCGKGYTAASWQDGSWRGFVFSFRSSREFGDGNIPSQNHDVNAGNCSFFGTVEGPGVGKRCLANVMENANQLKHDQGLAIQLPSGSKI